MNVAHTIPIYFILFFSTRASDNSFGPMDFYTYYPRGLEGHFQLLLFLVQIGLRPGDVPEHLINAIY